MTYVATQATAEAAEAAGAPTKVCPDCAETVLADARVCRFCGYEFRPSVEANLAALPVVATPEGSANPNPGHVRRSEP